MVTISEFISKGNGEGMVRGEILSEREGGGGEVEEEEMVRGREC